ncbi:MAG: PfkB family carbohydrate kinase [Terracidiphilus sp.]|jgi:sugar/nucleoside kinase (ribokinase family)
MNKLYDVLGAGIAAVDDLIYVSEYPPVDCKIPVHGSTRHGGGPACTAIAAVGSLGGRTAYAARFGEDELSKYIASALKRHGVDISHILRDPAGGPYHSIIVVDGAGHRNVFYDPALYKVVTADDLPEALIQSATLVLLDHITEPSLTALAEKVHRLGVPVLGDIEGRSESAMKLAALTDYLIVPKAWAAWASGAPDPREACALLAGAERLATVVTGGAGGCYFSTRTEPAVRHFPAFKVEAFDTTGCGDTFHGAFALAVARNLAVEEAIAFASAAAALKAMAAGGKRRGWDALPTLDAVLMFLSSQLPEPERSPLLRKLEVLSA